ncbi:CYFA0S42e00122g1_1 [Cyberlindnera fabianii]|uniref:CYFA0S42e00122g1_1 n=1 Tax=Cyberlindnera fabianii TaxID=36022 RepID=A0A061BF52_CYBFA|nr:CYFA0S42e00122g1_1 [Cyberlindnera fabianii]
MPTKTEEASVPIVDFGPYLSGTPEGKAKVGREMVSVMKEYGFMYMVNHGIPEKDQHRMFEWSKAFFQLSNEQKMKCPHPKLGAHHRGYSSIGKEKVSQLVYDEAELERLRQVPDVKESFDLGNESNKKYYNIWPDENDIPGFREFCIYYFKLCDATGKKFLRAIALGMGLDEEFFLEYHDKSDNQLRLLHYPPTDEASLKNGKAERIAAHTDHGTLTMLLQDECGGLQVENPYNKGVFLPAPFIKGSLVVNTGDFLQRWSNDALKSTLHRVTAPPVDSETGISKARYSIPFFISANKDCNIDVLEGTYSTEYPKKYEAINAGDWLAKRMNATY